MDALSLFGSGAASRPAYDCRVAKRDYYDVLGVGRGAAPDEIKKIYRKLARKFHPDVNPGDKAAQKRFQEIQEAYDVLRDDEKRRAYDRFGHAGARMEEPGDSGIPFDFQGFGGGSGGGFADFSSVFGDLFGGAGGPGGERFGRAAPADTRSSMEVPFRTAIFGGTLQLQTTRRSVCADCGGRGQKGRAPCPTCRGQGRIASLEKLRVKVPAGMREGGTIRLAGKGDTGPDGRPGDLYVTIHVQPHPYFERRDSDIMAVVPITIREAYSGGDVLVPTIHGPVQARVPPGTQGGQKFRLRGKGVHDPRSGSTGDHVYTVRVVVPTNETPAGREAAALFDSLYAGDPRKDLKDVKA